MNKRTIALTTQQYKEIISTMKKGFSGSRPNQEVATALMLEANLGLRISDILKLRLSDIVKDGERYRLAITEQKTGKARVFTVPLALYQFIRCYCLDHGILEQQRIFPMTTWAIGTSALTASGSTTPLKSIRTATITLPWCSSSSSTVALPSPRGTLASNHGKWRRPSRDICS